MTPEHGDEAQLSEQVTLSGTDYGGFPLPLTGITFHVPLTGNYSLSGLARCNRSALEPSGRGPKACPKGSIAGPPAPVQARVAFGTEYVPEEATAQTFYSSDGGLLVFVFGHSPVLLEQLIVGALRPDGAGASIADFEDPLVETVPGARLVSTQLLTVNLYTATSAGTAEPLLSLPSGCRQREVTYAAEARLNGGEVAAAQFPLACVAAVPAAPVQGRSQNVRAVSGTVLVRIKGSSAFVPLEAAHGLPDGSEVDTTAGTAAITAASHGAPATAEASGGRFLIHQPTTGMGRTDLTLTAPLSGCGAAGAGTAAHRRSSTRHLWVSEHGGHWSTHGRYVSTSVEGTRWLTSDTCKTSLVRVARGRVLVRDLVHRRTRLLHAGQSLTVSARSRRRAGLESNP